jgi:hypothetical protein
MTNFEKRGDYMAKIDLDSMSIEDLVNLRENLNAKLLEKVAAKKLELEAEMERLSNLGKPAKKLSAAAAPVKAKKGDKKAGEIVEPPVAEASLNEAA